MVVHCPVSAFGVVPLQRFQNLVMLAGGVDDRRLVYVPQKCPNAHDLFFQRKDDVAQIAVAGNRIELAVELVAQIAAAVVLARFERCIGGGQDFGQGVQLVGRRVGRRPAGGLCGSGGSVR